MLRFLLLFAVLLVGSVAQAAEYTVGDLAIANPWTRATAPMVKAGGGFMMITNRGTADDRLVAGSSPMAGRTEIHEMRIDDAGIMRMRELEKGLALPAGSTTELKPGGYHVMLMQLKEPLRLGSPVPVTLVFEKAGSVDLTLAVAPPGAPGMPGHGDGHGE